MIVVACMSLVIMQRMNADEPQGIPENGIKLYSQYTAECGCQYQIVLQKDSEAYFRDLDNEKEYYPMVASQSTKAFYASPPKALRPSQIESGFTSTNGTYLSSSCVPRPAHAEEHNSGMDMHGVSSSGEDNIDIDLF